MRAAPFAAAAIALAGALAPLDPRLFPLGDKALHIIAFALIGALAVRGGWRALTTRAALALFAIAIEVAQALWTSDRTASVIDASASMLGGLLGVLSGQLRQTRSVLAAACACIATGVAFDLTVNAARPAVTQSLLRDAWRVAAQTHTAQAPWLATPARVSMTLEVRGQIVPVVDAITRHALAMAPGGWPGVLPSEQGTTIILGHRNREFAALGGLKPGDVVTLTDVEGRVWRYRVSTRDVVRSNHSGLHQHTPGQTLALVTCWPIRSSQPTPWRLIVRATPEPLSS